MKRFLLAFFSILSVISAESQSDFEIPDDVDQVIIPFTNIQNLIIIQGVVNNTPLNFILDTGASNSIIFNLDRIDSLNIRSGNTLKVAGYGSSDPFEVYYSDDNRVSFDQYKSTSTDFFIMANQKIDLQSIIGKPIHGLIGHDFFKNYIIKVDYEENRIHIFRHESKVTRKLKNLHNIPIILKDRKPYVNTLVGNNGSAMSMSTLIDTGNGDALWILQTDQQFKMPKKGYADKLGVGMSGDVIGIRSKIEKVVLGKFELNSVTVSIPERESLTNHLLKRQNLTINSGSIGGEILHRFDVFFDYYNKQIYLKPVRSLRDGFYYNMAGLELKEGDIKIFSYVTNLNIEESDSGYGRIQNQKIISTSLQTVYKLAPKLIISYVRPDSPADQAGLQVGDVILKVNSVSMANLNRNKVSRKFFTNPYQTLRFKVMRDTEILKMKIKLVPLF